MVKWSTTQLVKTVMYSLALAKIFKSEKMTLVISSGLIILGLREYQVLTDTCITN